MLGSGKVNGFGDLSWVIHILSQVLGFWFGIWLELGGFLGC